MNRTLRRLAFTIGLLTFAGAAPAAEIVLELSAVDKIVAQGLFANAGRYDIVKGPCSAYLDRPSVTIAAG